MYESLSTNTKPPTVEWLGENKVQTLAGPGDGNSSFPWGVVAWVAVVGLALYLVSGSINVSAGLGKKNNPRLPPSARRSLPAHLHAAYDWIDMAGEWDEALRAPASYARAAYANARESGQRDVTESDLRSVIEWYRNR